MTGIVAHTYPEWWLKLTGQVAHWSTDYSANEPWHYRYVGKDAAETIHQSGMCLEEYIDTLD